MELQEFVSQTLKQIVDGTKTAQQHATGQGAKINPPDVSLAGSEGVQRLYAYAGHDGKIHTAEVQQVDFDVALTTAEEKEGKLGVGIFVAGIALGAKGQRDTSNVLVNRVKFSVPLGLPVSQ